MPLVVGWVRVWLIRNRAILYSGCSGLFQPGHRVRKRSLACPRSGDCGRHPYVGATMGIEKINKVLMPSFVLLQYWPSVWPFCRGAADDINSLFAPGLGDLLKVDTWVMAMGQAFSSPSITGSGMIISTAPIRPRQRIYPKHPSHCFFDTVAAMMVPLPSCSLYLHSALSQTQARPWHVYHPALRFSGRCPWEVVRSDILPVRGFCGYHRLQSICLRL